MSAPALLRGVERRLRSVQVLNDRPAEEIGKFVGVTPAPGNPPRAFGQYFLSIRYGGMRPNAPNPNLRHDVYEGVIVTLTARLNYSPGDRKGRVMTDTLDPVAFYELVELIKAPGTIHGQPLVLQYANELIEGTVEWCAVQDPPVLVPTVNGFTELLVVGPVQPERLATSAWVGTEKEVKDVYVIDIPFKDARRIQYNTAG